MKRSISMFIIAAALATGCTANLKMANLKIDKSLKPVKSGKTAVVSKITFFSGNSGTFSDDETKEESKLKKSISNAVYNSGFFEEVASTEDEVKNITNRRNLIYLDMNVYVVENGGFNWWIAWPGVYPCCGYWPIQPKKGTVAVNIEITASDNKKKLKTFKTYSADDYSFLFYGFYRTAPIENSAVKAFLGAVEQFDKEFPGIYSKDKNDNDFVGTIRELNSSSDIVIQHNEAKSPRMGELIYAISGDKKIGLIAMFPMMTVTKCRIVKNSDYPLLKKAMEIYK